MHQNNARNLFKVKDKGLDRRHWWRFVVFIVPFELILYILVVYCDFGSVLFEVRNRTQWFRNGTKYRRVDQVKFVEDNLWKKIFSSLLNALS